MEVNLSTVEFAEDVLAFHCIKAMMLIAEERFKYPANAKMGEPVGLLLDNEHLTIVSPVFCCQAHMDEGELPIAHIIIDEIPAPGWRFKMQGIAQA